MVVATPPTYIIIIMCRNVSLPKEVCTFFSMRYQTADATLLLCVPRTYYIMLPMMELFPFMLDIFNQQYTFLSNYTYLHISLCPTLNLFIFYIYVCMCVGVYVCMCIYVYVSMYVCVYIYQLTCICFLIQCLIYGLEWMEPNNYGLTY